LAKQTKRIVPDDGMTEEDNKSVEQVTVEALKRKRGACHRVITRLYKKAAQLTTEPLGSL